MADNKAGLGAGAGVALDENSSVFPIVSKLAKRDLADAKKMTLSEVRYAVDLYYQIQGFRKRTTLQIKSIDRAAKEKGVEREPTGFLEWTFNTMAAVEGTIKTALDVWTNEHPVGAWSKSIVGVGPVIAAGLLAYTNMDLGIHMCACGHSYGGHDEETGRCGRDVARGIPCTCMKPVDAGTVPIRHVGHLYSFAGLVPGVKWEKGKKRPWNARLKSLCWNLGQSFMKHRKGDDAYYGRIYERRKAEEIAMNRDGRYAEQARASLREKDFGDDTLAKLWYQGCLPGDIWDGWLDLTLEEQGKRIKERKGLPGSGVEMLPPARIELRAERYAVKWFLGHWFEVYYEVKWGKKAPRPWVIEFGGHTDLGAGPPNWPMPKNQK